MIGKCVFLLLFIGSIDAVLEFSSRFSGECNLPVLKHGRVRMRQRSKMAKFICLPRYELAGNKYATCKDGNWDVPLPVCVRPSCPIPEIVNGLRLASHSGAWIIFFCLPDHKLVGSPVIYCDGYRWNASAPSCVDAKSPPRLSCDFEDPSICGWTQDELHDFDWTRYNSKTPSSFHYTGPSYDHTFGEGNYGYFMYIESSSQIQNDTARLVSPVYDSSLAKDGCFSLYYHMYGKGCGGLRVYQKPNNVTLRRMLDLSDEEKQSYLIFEKWGNLGDQWFNAVTSLKDFDIDFQIVIEGIRGKNYTSDIAIDDVAILQGANCSAALSTTPSPPSPPATMPFSCVNRCNILNEHLVSYDDCNCDLGCLDRHDCCNNFFDVCMFAPDPSPTEETIEATTSKTSIAEAPQTLKLVRITTESTTTTPAPTTTPSTTTRRPTTSTTTSTTSTTSTTTTPKPTTTSTARTTTRRTTTRILTSIATKPTTTQKTTTTKATTTRRPVTSTVTYRTVSTKITTSTIKYDNVSKPIETDSFQAAIEKAKKEQSIERRTTKPLTVLAQPKGMSTSAKTLIVILALTLCSVSALAIVVGLRSVRGQIALARFRGRRNRDPEVRYLSHDVDDD